MGLRDGHTGTFQVEKGTSVVGAGGQLVVRTQSWVRGIFSGDDIDMGVVDFVTNRAKGDDGVLDVRTIGCGGLGGV